MRHKPTKIEMRIWNVKEPAGHSPITHVLSSLMAEVVGGRVRDGAENGSRCTPRPIFCETTLKC